MTAGDLPAMADGGGAVSRAAVSSRSSSSVQDFSQFVQRYKIPLILLYYGFCSSTLIVINKVAVHNLRAPVFILILQLLFAAGTVKGLNVSGVLDAEKLQWSLVRPFLLIVAGFLGEQRGMTFRVCCVVCMVMTHAAAVSMRHSGSCSPQSPGMMAIEFMHVGSCQHMLTSSAVQIQQLLSPATYHWPMAYVADRLQELACQHHIMHPAGSSCQHSHSRSMQLRYSLRPHSAIPRGSSMLMHTHMYLGLC
jgi:hypothetical protein